MTFTSAVRRIDTAQKDFEIGAERYALKELIRFAELAGELAKESPRAFHEVWQCVKDDYSLRLYANELIRLGMSNAHPWLNDPIALMVARFCLPFFFREQIQTDHPFGARTLELRHKSFSELVVGKEYERGLIHLAFLKSGVF